MLIPESVKCDVCEIYHGESNGWFTVVIGGGVLTILAYSDEYKNRPAVCGENCLHRFLSPHLNQLHRKGE